MPFYSCIKLYSDDVQTVLKKLERHYVTSIYTLCSSCNRDRDPSDWCNPYTFIDEDKKTVKEFFENSVDKMSAFISNPKYSGEDGAMKRFIKLVELNKDNRKKLNQVSPIGKKKVTSDLVKMDNQFEVLSRFAFADQKSKHQFNKNPRNAIKTFEPLFDAVKKTSGGNKTHKLRIKNKNKTKSFRHKTRNTINRL
jgi:membrane-bound lytic murein transglycosylase